MPEPPDTEQRNQYIAVLLIILSLIAVAFADKANLRDLANAGQTVLGFGGGILTSKIASKLSQATTQGPIINEAPAETKEP